MVLFILTDPLKIKLESIVKRLPKELAATILIQLNSIKLESNQDDEKDQVEDEDVEDKVIDHKLLVEVSNWAKSKGIKEQKQFRISELLKLTNIYVPTLKPREKSAELLKILSRIQEAQDKASYNSMTSLANPQPTSLIPLNDIYESSNRTKRTEAEEWKEVQKQTSAIMNVVASMFAVGTAVWWVGGGGSYAMRLSLAFSGAVAIAAIEGFLYWRIFSQSSDEKTQKKVLKFESERNYNSSLELKL